MSGYWVVGGVFATIVTGGGGCGGGGKRIRWGCGCGGGRTCVCVCVWVNGLWKVIGGDCWGCNACGTNMAKYKSWLRPRPSSKQ